MIERQENGAMPNDALRSALALSSLVTLVGPSVGTSDVVGIYRVDGPDSFTVIADIGAFSLDNPPNTPFFVPTGVQYALQTYRGGFLVTDGHTIACCGAPSTARSPS